jgi:hypothetical protein
MEASAFSRILSKRFAECSFDLAMNDGRELPVRKLSLDRCAAPLRQRQPSSVIIN